MDLPSDWFVPGCQVSTGLEGLGGMLQGFAGIHLGHILVSWLITTIVTDI